MSDEMENELMDEEIDILTLVDDEGVEHQFEIVDDAEFEGSDYIALVPIYDQPEELLEDSGDLVILRVSEEDGEEILESIEDEDEFERVSAYFMERLSDAFDFE